jgi:hypothetical protein
MGLAFNADVKKVKKVIRQLPDYNGLSGISCRHLTGKKVTRLQEYERPKR